MTTNRDWYLLNLTSGATVVPHLEITETTWEATVGLLGRRGLAPGRGLLIEGCRSIHMFFMIFPIDVVYLDEGLRVLKVVANLRPWRLSGCWRAKFVLELPAGGAAVAKIEPEQILCLQKTAGENVPVEALPQPQTSICKRSQ